MSSSSVDLVCTACLSCETVAERLGEVCAVPHPGGRLTKGDTGCIEQARVGVTERVPSHAWPMHPPKGVHKCLTCSAVVAIDGKWYRTKDFPGSCGEGNHTLPGACLRWVDSPDFIAGPPDPEDMALYIAWLYGDGFAPAQPGEQDQLSDLSPYARHARDDLFDLDERQAVPAWYDPGNPRSVWGYR